MEKEFECTKNICIGGGVCGALIVLVAVLIASIGVVQFDEIAFARAWGQSIDQTQVFTQGRHFLGFWKSFVTFPATVIDLQLNNLEVFTSSSDDDAGTTVDLNVGIQYQLDPARLSDLFDIGGERGFLTQIEAEAIETIKNKAPSFNADFYLTNRRAVEAAFLVELQNRIADNFANTQVINVQLLRIPFPESFYQRKLDVGLQALRNEIQNFTRLTVNVRDETQREVLFIQNRAKVIVENATAQASLVVAVANNEFERLLGEAKETAINAMAADLGATTQSDYLSLNYLIQMLNNDGQQKKFVNFGNLPPAVSLV